MKTLYCIIASLILSVTLFGQAPPVLRQALTTNTAPVNPTNPGQIPIWTGTAWQFGTNLPGLVVTGLVSGDLLWTNDSGFLRPATLLNAGIGLGVVDAVNTIFGVDPVTEQGFYVWKTNSAETVHSILGVSQGGYTNFGSIHAQSDRTRGRISLEAQGNETNYSSLNLANQRVGAGGLIGNAAIQFSQNGTLYLSLNPTRGEFGTEPSYYHLDTSTPEATLPLMTVANKGTNKVAVLKDGSITNAGGIQTLAGITNFGSHQHTVGAFTGALFVSSNANGAAYWSTNIPMLNVTNFSFGGTAITNIDQNWTNDTVVLRTSETNTSPPLRVGMAAGGASGSSGIPMSDFWRSTNVGMGSIGFGSNVLSRGRWGSVLGGTLNEIGTNATRSVIAGGDQNWIDTNAHTSFIGGGGKNRIRPAAGTDVGGFASVIVGGTNNIIQYGANSLGGAFLGGGGDNTVNSNHTVLVGGFGNTLRGDYAVLVGGINNTLGSGFAGQGTRGAMLGGEQCSISDGNHAVLGGGFQNGIGGTSVSGAFGFIGGGAKNQISPTATGTATNAVISGGTSNSINSSSHAAVIGGGAVNSITQATNAVIAGGAGNSISGISGSGRNSIISGGQNNTLSGHVDFGFILGSSNLISTNWAGIIGWKATNTTTPYSITIAPQGETSKTIFTTSNLTVRSSFATVPDAVVTLAADNQVVDATLRTHIRLASDSAVAGDRTFLLTGTNVTSGAHAILEWTGTNAGELVDDSANSGAGNIRLSATWTPTQYDTLSLIFNGTDWIETARATN